MHLGWGELLCKEWLFFGTIFQSDDDKTESTNYPE